MIIGQFRYPIRTSEAFGLLDPQPRSNEDIAADLDHQDRALEDYLSSTVGSHNVATFGYSLDRGRHQIVFDGGTTMTGNVQFSKTFRDTIKAPPRVIVTVEASGGEDMRAVLLTVTTNGFTVKVTSSTASTAVIYVHWVAISV